MLQLMCSDDLRVAAVAANAVLDRAFGRPRDFDPKAEGFAISHLLPRMRSSRTGGRPAHHPAPSAGFDRSDFQGKPSLPDRTYAGMSEV